LQKACNIKCTEAFTYEFDSSFQHNGINQLLLRSCNDSYRGIGTRAHSILLLQYSIFSGINELNKNHISISPTISLVNSVTPSFLIALKKAILSDSLSHQYNFMLI
jgi:hypothetical protein